MNNTDYTNIGADFIQSDGQRLCCIQKIQNGKAVACIDFVDRKVSRFLSMPHVNRFAFLKEAVALRRNSIPVRFV